MIKKRIYVLTLQGSRRNLWGAKRSAPQIACSLFKNIKKNKKNKEKTREELEAIQKEKEAELKEKKTEKKEEAKIN